MRLLDRFRPRAERSFKSYIKFGKESGDETLIEQACRYEERIPHLLAEYYPSLSLSDIENMKWRDVQFKVSHIEKKLLAQVKALEKLADQIVPKPKASWALGKYSNVIVSRGDNR
jgi:hypothetical protein